MTWPNDVTTRVVTGTYVTPSGAAAKGRVTFTPTARVVDEDDAVIIEDTQTATLNSSGSFSIELPTTDNELLSPSGWAYEVSVRLYGVRPQKFFAFLPYGDGSTVDLLNEISTSSSPVTDSTVSYSTRGPIGPRGPGVVAGEGAPSNSEGQDGDIYIDSDTGTYYGPKADGAWPVEVLYQPGQTLRHVHSQPVASTTWSITHALGGRPSVMIVDTGGNVVIGDISYNSDTSVTVSFTAAFSGYAYLT